MESSPSSVPKGETRAHVCTCGRSYHAFELISAMIGTMTMHGRPLLHQWNCWCNSTQSIAAQDAPATLVRAARNADAMRVVGRF